MVTLVSIVPQAANSPERVTELGAILRSVAEKKRLCAFARVYASDEPFSEMRALVHAYGFGPFVPDTVLVGVSVKSPHLDSVSRFASYLHENGRSAIFVRERSEDVAAEEVERKNAPERIDVWWRGRNQNGSFMLALASLMARSSARKTRIRLCRIAEKGTEAAEAERGLKNFLAASRVEADIFVTAGEAGVSPMEIIAEASADAQYAFIGLRPPTEEDSPESYADYFSRMREGTLPLRSAVFALAADGVDFKRIYSA
jgi:hypothetical protein